MNAVLVLLRKEFRQIFRNRAMLPIIFVMPIVQLLVLAFAATFEVRETPVTLVADSFGPDSRLFVSRLEASGYFEVVSWTGSMTEADRDMQARRSRAIIRFPDDFERGGRMQVIVDAQDGATAGVVQAYISSIAAQTRGGLGMQPTETNSAARAAWSGEAPAAPIEIRSVHLYNPNLEYEIYMVPGILVVLVTMIGTFLSAMNLVREKEIGTIEQLNVTPIRKSELILGKLLPFWIIALFELAFGLGIAWLVFRIPIEGSLILIFVLAAVYLISMLGLGLWISAITETQQQAMFISWFVLVIFILMSGLFTPIESMPEWAQWLTRLNPVAYFIEIMRRVLLKGAGLDAVLPQVLSLVVYAAAILSLAIRKYRKVAG